MATMIVVAAARISNLKYRMKNWSGLRAEIPCAQILHVVVGDRRPGFYLCPANGLVQCVYSAFNFEDFVAIEFLHRDDNVGGACRILLEHSRVGLQASAAHIDRLPPNVVADSRRVDSASIQNDDVRRTAGATRRAMRRALRDGRRKEDNQYQRTPCHLRSPKEMDVCDLAQHSNPLFR